MAGTEDSTAGCLGDGAVDVRTNKEKARWNR